VYAQQGRMMAKALALFKRKLIKIGTINSSHSQRVEKAVGWLSENSMFVKDYIDTPLGRTKVVFLDLISESRSAQTLCWILSTLITLINGQTAAKLSSHCPSLLSS
jgi:hypothetical protein